MKIASAAQMRFLDRCAIEKFDIPEEILMENAGIAAFNLVRRKATVCDKKFVIFCGTGNNGGDGLVIARLLCSGRGMVKIILVGNSEKFQGAAKRNFSIVTKLPLEITKLEHLTAVRKILAHSDFVIDAIFGTGLNRPVTGLTADTIRLINQSHRKVLSLDIPSGVNGDTGEVMEEAIRADYTVTFGLPKLGNMLYPGYERCGELFVNSISFPPSLLENDEIKVMTNDPIALPKRPTEAYKGLMGDVLFIAGAANYYGAPYLAAMSFLKSGGGYARLAAPRCIIPVIAKRGREIVYLPQEETSSGSLSLKNKDQLLEMASTVDMVVIGPGLSLHEETIKLTQELVAEINVPVLVDGDGLTAIAKNPKVLKSRKAPTILTPHMGEMSRLIQRPSAEINKNKIPILRESVQALKSIIVLKGAHSLIGTFDGNIYMNMSGNAGMATAGSGDVLTGCIAAMLGMGLKPAEAVRKGVFLHGYAGDLAASKKVRMA